MYGLKNIFVVDSYLPKATTVPSDANVNLSGTNGTGKTTTLKLIPFFYGLAPSTINQNQSGKESFVDWYLPRPTSLIVYEYTRESGDCCAVVSRHWSGKKPVYRFLKSAFDFDHFTTRTPDGELSYIKSADLPRHWNELGLTYSNQVENVQDYRAIIQNDRQFLARNGAMSNLAAQYNLGDRNTRLPHMEKVTYALVSQSGNMDKMKMMISEIMKSNSVKAPELSEHHQNEAVIADISVIRAFSEKMSAIETTINEGIDLSDTSSEIHQIAGILTGRIESLSVATRNTETERETLTDEITSAVDQMDATSRSFKLVIDEQSDKIDSLDRNIDLLQTQANKWSENNIVERRQKLDNLSTYQSHMADALERFNILIEGQKEIEGQFDKQEISLLSNHQKHLSRLNADRDDLIANKNTQEKAAEAKKDQVRFEFDRKLQALLHTQSSEKDEANAYFHQTKSAYDNPSHTEEEALAIGAAESAVEHSEHALSPIKITQNKALATADFAKSKMDKAESDYRTAAKSVSLRQEELDGLDRLLNPHDNSLLHALRSQDPEWAAHIGKLIDPALLDRRDLKPTRAGDSKAFSGWEFDLDAIDLPAFASNEAELQARLEAKQSELTRAEDHQKSAEKEFRKTQNDYDEANKSLNEANRRVKSADATLSAARQALKDTTREARSARDSRKIEAKKIFAQAKKSLDELVRTHNDDKALLESQKSDAIIDIAGIWSEEASRLNEQIGLSEGGISNLKSSHQQKIEQLKSDRRAALKEGGVDESTLDQARINKESARTAVEVIEADRGLVADYNLWNKVEWPKMSDYASALTAAKSAKTDAAQNLRAHKKSAGAEINSMKSNKVTLDAKIKAAKDEINAVRTALDSDLLRTPPGEASVQSTKMLINEISAMMDSKRKLLTSVKEGVFRAETIIGRHPDSQIYKAWQKIREETASMAGKTVDDAELWRSLTPGLDDLIKTVYPQNAALVMGHIEALGTQLANFYQGLSVVQKGIKSQSNKLSGAISDKMAFESITDLQLRLTPKINQLDYWKDLEEFYVHWVEWTKDGSLELPSKELEESLGKTIQILKTSRITGDIESLFDFSIDLKDKGRPITVRTDKQLDSVGSEGLSYLNLCSIMMGITSMLRSNPNVAIHWPLDELGKIHPENILILFKMLKDNNVIVMGGFPSPDLHLLKHFTHRRVFDKLKGLIEIEIEESDLDRVINEEVEAMENE